MKVEIQQIAYNDETLAMVSPKAQMIFNANKDRSLENRVIADYVNECLVEDLANTYIGILSARFEQKISWKSSVNTIADIIEQIERDGFSAEVYSFFGAFTRRNVWIVAERWQPGVLAAGRYLCNEIWNGVDITELNTPIIYQNAFVAYGPIYKRYVDEALRPALRIIDTDTVLQQLLDKDSKYRALHRLKGKDCEAVFGRPYYTLHPFVLERLFSTWLAMNPDITIKHI
jgi:hypothetical protein